MRFGDVMLMLSGICLAISVLGAIVTYVKAMTAGILAVRFIRSVKRVIRWLLQMLIGSAAFSIFVTVAFDAPARDMIASRLFVGRFSGFTPVLLTIFLTLLLMQIGSLLKMIGIVTKKGLYVLTGTQPRQMIAWTEGDSICFCEANVPEEMRTELFRVPDNWENREKFAMFLI